MPNYQTASNVWAAIKRETVAGVAAPAGAGALLLRLTDSPGLALAIASVASNERRRDLLQQMPRNTGRSVAGTYNMELTLGGAVDSAFEAVQRALWAPPLVLNIADASTTATKLVRATGSWIVDGIRVGDIVTPTADATAANNNLRLRVVAVTALELTVAGIRVANNAQPLTVNAAPRAITVTRMKKLSNPAVPTRYAYTAEQYDADIDYSELFTGVRLTGLAVSIRPGAISTLSLTLMGIDSLDLDPAMVPYFTDPVVTVGVPFVADDAVIRHAGADVSTFTGLDLTWAIAATGTGVVGSQVSPDIFDNTLTISGSVSGIRQDFNRLRQFRQETEFDLSALFTEPNTSPLAALGFYLPRVKFGGLDAPFLGGDGPKIETLPLVIGPREAATGYDATAVNIFSSAPYVAP